ncbi:hypothetical protein CO2235_230216 [Cupriavidus oxalaticus]|uniref:Uncharacterized protein n=1 Tax=Cupriavidus oxalaticus TaxID=96344 RepID=A0A976BDU9_9BURK|nr:hypothetical protein CO2235_230216 [Cupriavidus oxalaticus]
MLVPECAPARKTVSLIPPFCPFCPFRTGSPYEEVRSIPFGFVRGAVRRVRQERTGPGRRQHGQRRRHQDHRRPG